MLAVKAVLALDDAGVQGLAHGLGGPGQAVHDLKVRHGGELDGGVFHAGVLKPDGAGGHHDVAGLNVHIDAAAGAGADKGVRAALVELLHGNGRGGAADAGGAGGHLFAQECAGPDIVFPVAGHLLRIVKQGGNGGHPARIAGHDAVAAHVAGGAADMKLLFKLLHIIHLMVDFLPV